MPGETIVHVTVQRVAAEGSDEPPSTLDDAERAVWAGFRGAADRRLYGAAHALLRSCLSRHADVDSSAWRFAAAPGTRPELDPAFRSTGLRFSLTHTRGLVACAVTHGRSVGLDAESLPAPGDWATLARRFFAPSETRALLALPAAAAGPAFIRIWTLKEAYVKARGLGLALDLASFTIGGDPPRIAPDPGGERLWYAASRPVGQSHIVSLALPQDGPAEPLVRWDGEAVLGG